MMYKIFGIFVLFYITGWLYINLYCRKNYMTSIVEEMSKPFIIGDLRKMEDDRKLVRSDLVLLLGGLFWVFIFLLLTALYWAGIADLVTPLQEWLLN